MTMYRQEQEKTLGLKWKKMNLIELEQGTGKLYSFEGDIPHAVVTDIRGQSYRCFLKIDKEQINWISKIKGVKIREGKLTGNKLKKT